MSIRPTDMDQAHKSEPLKSLKRREESADMQADMNWEEQCQWVIAATIVGWLAPGAVRERERGERVTMKHATALLPCCRATWRGVKPLESRAVGDERVWLRMTANNLTSSTEAEGGGRGGGGVGAVFLKAVKPTQNIEK